MERRRRVVRNRVQCDHMAMWGVCGSAIAMGNEWKADFSKRKIDPNRTQFFEVLPGCCMHYQANSGPHGVKVCNDPYVFVTSSGTGITGTRQWALAFPCATKGNAYAPVCQRINDKLPSQLQFFQDRYLYFSRREAELRNEVWRLHWITGHLECLNPMPRLLGSSGDLAVPPSGHVPIWQLLPCAQKKAPPKPLPSIQSIPLLE